MSRQVKASFLIAAIAAATAWFGRGTYDEFQMDEGVFHVVNADDAPRTIKLAFPSGERRRSVIDAGQAVDFEVKDTGEGAVSVTSDGELLGSVGYVTSHNDLSVVVVRADRVLISQYGRGRALPRQRSAR